MNRTPYSHWTFPEPEDRTSVASRSVWMPLVLELAGFHILCASLFTRNETASLQFRLKSPSAQRIDRDL